VCESFNDLVIIRRGYYCTMTWQTDYVQWAGSRSLLTAILAQHTCPRN